MNIKNVKLGEYTLKDLLSEIIKLGEVACGYRNGYIAIKDKLIEILREIK